MSVMMECGLEPAAGVSIACDHGHAIILALCQNRYWSIPFDALRADDHAALSDLVARGVLKRQTETRPLRIGAARTQARPTRAPFDARATIADQSLFGISALRAENWVRSGRLDRAASFLARKREELGLERPALPLHEAHAKFEALRPWWPADRVCLFDSLALALFLLRHGHRARVVFGVRASPFSAHCWVECAGDLLCDLNGQAHSYAIIQRI